MSGRPGCPGVALAVMATLMAAVIGLQAVHERGGGPPASDAPEFLYVRSPEAMRRLALSYQSLVADLYWIRAVQHYGGTRLSANPDKRYELLYPLLDLTTTLEPRFNVAYLFGSLFLAESPPGGPGRPDLAIALLDRGLRAQPSKWEFAQAIGFVHYWWRHDYEQAAEWFTRAAKFPNAPFWLTTLAATTLAEGGSRGSSRILWEQFARSAETEALRNEAVRRLQQLDAMDQMDRLRQMVDAYRQRGGALPSGWIDLVRAGYLRALPADPAGTPYVLQDGAVMLGRGSRLFPLPIEPQRLVH
ncbi:MAG: hypothetical protein A3H29_03275 [Acidobacteria bacterium RIFCSPLOWO2_02_FULL_67_21]|nr:MAG: hypothetical protein A3H29_03275 [Acidobacteria bacterium RIFCSPLOWO2_02_FULL_67_21]